MGYAIYARIRSRVGTPFVSVLLSLVCLCVVGSPATAGNFSISPVKFEFDVGQRTGILTVANESDAELALQIRVFAWSQENGEDRFEPTDDIVYFPRIFTVGGLEERIVRLGLKVRPGEVERSYRMYLEELPSPRESEGTTVRTLMRVGIPIFLRPAEVVGDPAVEDVSIEDGNLSFRLVNRRNRYFKYGSIVISGTDTEGEEIHRATVDGWYLLAGASKAVVTEIAPDRADDLRRIEITVRGTDEAIVAEHSIP